MSDVMVRELVWCDLAMAVVLCNVEQELACGEIELNTGGGELAGTSKEGSEVASIGEVIVGSES